MEEDRTYLPITDIEGVTPILNRISILGGLSGDQIYKVFKVLMETKYSSGEFIFRKGDEPRYIYIVRKGYVKIILDPDNPAVGSMKIGVGSCFGEASLIAIEPHEANAVADQDTEVMVLSRKALLSLFESEKDIFSMLILNIAREVCRRLHKTDEILLRYFHSKE